MKSLKDKNPLNSSISNIPVALLERYGSSTVTLPNHYSSDTVTLQNCYCTGKVKLLNRCNANTVLVLNRYYFSTNHPQNGEELRKINFSEFIPQITVIFGKTEHSESQIRKTHNKKIRNL